MNLNPKQQALLQQRFKNKSTLWNYMGNELVSGFPVSSPFELEIPPPQ